MPVWFSVQATPAKAFSVFPNLLCKQGAAGSSPATSTNYIFFQRNSFDVFSAYHLLLRQVVRGSNHLTSSTTTLYLSYDLCCVFDYRLPFPGVLGATTDSASRTTVTIK